MGTPMQLFSARRDGCGTHADCNGNTKEQPDENPFDFIMHNIDLNTMGGQSIFNMRLFLFLLLLGVAVIVVVAGIMLTLHYYNAK